MMSLSLAKLKASKPAEARDSYPPLPDDIIQRLLLLFPHVFTAPFADHHLAFWEWVSQIDRFEKPRPFVGIWPRGGGKSSSVEEATILMGAERLRKYCWYVSATQSQADDKVENIAAEIERDAIAHYFPSFAERKVGKYGQPRAWRRTRLMTASGFTIDAVGLDKAARGLKVEEQRPDLIILDDIDDQLDTHAKVKKKRKLITKKILPAADSKRLAVIAIQNLIIPHGLFAELAVPIEKGGADWLADRYVSGPIKAINDIAYEQTPDGKFKITAGTATWKGQNMQVAQTQVNDWGITTFLEEANHEVEENPDGLYAHIEFQHCELKKMPKLRKTAVWCDPAVTSTDKSDSMGIQVDGMGVDGKLYRLYSYEGITTPEKLLRMAIEKAVYYEARMVGVESDQGGDTWKTVYRSVLRDMQEEGLFTFIDEDGEEQDILKPKFGEAKAGSTQQPKEHRQAQMVVSYEQGKIVHVIGTHAILERALRRVPNKPLDLADAAFWSWSDLMGKRKGIKF